MNGAIGSTALGSGVDQSIVLGAGAVVEDQADVAVAQSGFTAIADVTEDTDGASAVGMVSAPPATASGAFGPGSVGEHALGSAETLYGAFEETDRAQATAHVFLTVLGAGAASEAPDQALAYGDAQPLSGVPVWPRDLPQKALTEGYAESLGDGRLKTPMDAGPPKMRRRFTGPRPISVKLFLDRNGKARLDRFWSEETAGGTKPFLIPAQVEHGVPLADEHGNRLQIDGQALLNDDWWLVMFGDQAPSISGVEAIYCRASFDIVRMP